MMHTLKIYSVFAYFFASHICISHSAIWECICNMMMNKVYAFCYSGKRECCQFEMFVCPHQFLYKNVKGETTALFLRIESSLCNLITRSCLELFHAVFRLQASERNIKALKFWFYGTITQANAMTLQDLYWPKPIEDPPRMGDLMMWISFLFEFVLIYKIWSFYLN